MTEREAIEAIKGLENIIEYWTHRPGEVVTAKLAIQALEKQVGRKPDELSEEKIFYDGGYYGNKCGECGIPVYDEQIYCDKCGNKIDWSEEE